MTDQPRYEVGTDGNERVVEVSAMNAAAVTEAFPTVAGHVYMVSKIMWLTVSEQEYTTINLLVQFLQSPAGFQTMFGERIQSAFLSVEFALSAFDHQAELFALEPTVHEILLQARAEGCDYLVARTA